MTTETGIDREILVAFWKVHVLHHAGEEPVVGLWMLRELERHGYRVSPGTLYPLLARMEERGWLSCKVDPRAGPRARKEYRLTRLGRAILGEVRHQIEELYREVVLGEDEDRHPAASGSRRATKRPSTSGRRGGRRTRPR